MKKEEAVSGDKRHQILDKVGICTSIVCLIHCLSIPLLLGFGFDSIMRMVDQEWIEVVIIAFALIIGATSFLSGFLKHRQHHIPVLFVSGFLLLINGESVGHLGVSIGLSMAGAIIIAYAHFQNLKWKQYAFTG